MSKAPEAVRVLSAKTGTLAFPAKRRITRCSGTRIDHSGGCEVNSNQSYNDED
ncbi:hypothetical protein [Sporolactobacillus terrae]|uniref:hypothetical protein n=1 Tax=Sporolactobacillus terrae TaxID=269673 RepID=UPI0013E3D296|nr:hypothetical protein [Sporolactobacillus terrae]UAK16478.1 hypothetical protein K7399_00370 [Sporolactobacillus terrae]